MVINKSEMKKPKNKEVKCQKRVFIDIPKQEEQLLSQEQ